MTVFSLETVIRLAHLLAAVTWVGGLIYTHFVLTPPATGKGIPPAFVRLMCMQRFKWFALGSLGLLVITGIYNVFAKIPSLNSDLFSAPWGTVLLLKVALTLAAIAVTAFTSLILGPRVVANAPKPGPKAPGPSPALIGYENKLMLLSQVNLALGVLILYLALLLVR